MLNDASGFQKIYVATGYIERQLPMAKMGRPAVEEPKDKRVSVQVTEKEHYRIMAYAEKQNITVAELIHKAIEQYMERSES